MNSGSAATGRPLRNPAIPEAERSSPGATHPCGFLCWGFLTFQGRAVVAMPKLSAWMKPNRWLVNIIVCVIFIALIL